MRTGLVFFAAMLTAFSARVSGAPLDDATVWIYGTDAEARTVRMPTRTPLTRTQGVSRTFSQRNATLSASLGYRRETLDVGVPLPHSKEAKASLQGDMTEVRLKGDWRVVKGLVLEGEVAYAYTSGSSVDVRYKDVSGNTKLLNSDTTRVSLGVGWRFAPGRNVALTPLVGYGWQRHSLSVRAELREKEPIDEDISGARLRYKQRLDGPWAGLRLDFLTTDKLEFRLGVKRQWFDSRVNANGVVYEDDDSWSSRVRQRDYVEGWQWEIGAAWWLTPQSAVSFELEESENETKAGIRRHGWSANLGYRMNY